MPFTPRSNPRHALWVAVLLLQGLGGGQPLSAQPLFTDVSAERGLVEYQMAQGMGGGVAVADFDDDGDVDLFVPTAGGSPDQLYHNLGDGSFQEIALLAGVNSTANHRAALWLDFDGDDRLDLFVGGDCYSFADYKDLCENPTPCSTPPRLYRQVADARFEDVTAAAGLESSLIATTCQQQGGMAAGDLDGDGDLDLFTGTWGTGSAAWLFRNNGDGTFTDVTAASGIDTTGGDYWQPVLHDFNRDGRLDIYAARDSGKPNQLWVAQGDGTFVDRAADAFADNSWNDMGVTLGDADNDGDLDIYITNIELAASEHYNLLLRNDSSDGGLLFTPLSSTGAENGGWGWGATFFDAENDGDLDLAATNGFWNEAGVWVNDTSKFFLSVDAGNLAFEDFSSTVAFNDDFWGSALVSADTDRDGDLDLLQTCNGNNHPEDPELDQTPQLRILENQLQGDDAANAYLVIEPRMAGMNRRAIGAVVRLDAGGIQRTRWISAGTSFFGQEPAEAFFGLGGASRVDRITIEWPGGGPRTLLGPVSVNQRIRVEQLFADGFERGDLSAWQVP